MANQKRYISDNELREAYKNAIGLRQFVEKLLGTTEFSELIHNEWYRNILSLQLAISEEIKEMVMEDKDKVRVY